MILDTTFLIDILRARPDAVSLLDELPRPLLTTCINRYEVLVGVSRLGVADSKKKISIAQALFDKLTVLPLSDRAVIESALICADLLNRGEETGDNDCLIAGIAKAHGVDEIVTRNNVHFKRIKFLKVRKY